MKKDLGKRIEEAEEKRKPKEGDAAKSIKKAFRTSTWDKIKQFLNIEEEENNEQ
jgi:hypothetical protein